MLFHFSIWPLDDAHMSKDIASVARKFDAAQLRYSLGAMGITVEGEWPDVMPVIHECHQALAASHARVLTQITIDQPAQHKSMAESVERVRAAASA